ncbi:MAG: hypothetical protein RKP20_05155 [Candidatus Competibacter sp.]|nr:hypothetical protein [Candidatus Competibacter sp.]MDS4069310.1 hypothetical protein [Candidatus Competibacter sp.]
MTEAVGPPFRQRLHQVERAPGFVRLDVLGPLVYSSPASRFW